MDGVPFGRRQARAGCADLAIPAEVPADGLAEYLDDIYHELSGPGDRISRIG